MSENLLNSFAQQKRHRFNGYIPLYNSTLGKPIYRDGKEKKNYFAENHRSRLNTSWCPAKKAKMDPPLIIQCPKIYYSHIGMLPNYGGHVPGDTFRFGETFGNGSRDSKRYLN